MKTLIIGLGLSGKAAASLLLFHGKKVIGVDKTISQNGEFPTFFDHEPIDFSTIEQVIVSPGIPRSHPLYKQALQEGIEVIGEIELALRYLKNPSLAVTGTNGKTTVTLLAAHVLNMCGYRARALGNIGDPLCAYCLAPKEEEILVIELSSYQLETMTTPYFEAGVILNITPDHLDRYEGMNDYAAAKCRLQYCMKPSAPLFLHPSVLEKYQSFFSYHSLVCIEKEFSKQQGMGKHDWENALAAWKLVEPLGIAKEQFLEAILSFKKPSHRIEFLAEIDGVSYYDDSKGTNVDAVIAAVETMQTKTILIAGGVDKGSSYSPWIQSFAHKVKKIVVFGEAADKMNGELAGNFSVQKVSTLQEAVALAAEIAKPGDSVLLSPGCASFDMFRDYAHRGEEFKRLVYDLQTQVTREEK